MEVRSMIPYSVGSLLEKLVLASLEQAASQDLEQAKRTKHPRRPHEARSVGMHRRYPYFQQALHADLAMAGCARRA